MNYEVLKKVNQYIRRHRPFFDSTNPCAIFRTDTLLEIGFLSRRCMNDALGNCIMCDYGAASGTQCDDIYLQEMDRILKTNAAGIETLLLCSNGSILNPNQISDNLFRKILIRAALSDIPEIEIECHYRDVTTNKLDTLKELLPAKKIRIELGLETVNPIYQKYLIGKGIEFPRYEETISRIQQYGFGVDLNFMLGLPFLNSKQQLEDAQMTLCWILKHNCNAVLFPVNIKPFTLLMHMYQTGYYEPISHWLMLTLLDSVPEDELCRITVAWYGNREEVYPGINERAIFPTCCTNCAKAIEDFYIGFMKSSDSNLRKSLIKQCMALPECDCRTRLKESCNQKYSDQSFKENYDKYAALLTREFSFLFNERHIDE